jgi:hypothetical protein
MATFIEILDSDLNFITRINSPYPLNKSGIILQYSKELSDFGQCKFRISNYDTLFTDIGDITEPHKYHVRINRGGKYVWQGAIIENSKRTKDFTEVVAAEYLWYLGKLLINRTSKNPVTNTADGVYRIFKSGTMSAAVGDILDEVIARYDNTNHALSSLSKGTIENPDYPPNMVDGSSTPKKLTGAWSFGNGTTAPQLTFDFQSVLYVLKSFGTYTYADFNIDSDLKFNFKKFLGNDRHYDVNFVWGKHGNAVDFNITRLGQRQVNDVWGIAVDNTGKILHQEQSDEDSKKVNGILEGVMAFADIKDQGTLNARIAAELPLISTVDASADTFVLDETAYPLGLYDIGDIVSARVDHTALTYKEIKRIVGISVSLHNTGRELTTVQLNTPLPWQYGDIHGTA